MRRRDRARRATGTTTPATFPPPKGKIFTGVSDTGQSSDFAEFREQTGAHPAVMQSFESWGYVPKEALGRWTDTNTRGMLSLSTAKCWGCPDVISPRSIAEGKGDRYIVALGKALAHRRKPDLHPPAPGDERLLEPLQRLRLRAAPAATRPTRPQTSRRPGGGSC